VLGRPRSGAIADGDRDGDARRPTHQVLGGERRRQRTHDPLGVLIDRRAAHALRRLVLANERLTILAARGPSGPAARRPNSVSWGEGGWCDLHALSLVNGSDTIGLQGRLREG